MNDFITRDYCHGDYDAILNLWNLTGLGNPARGDSEETIERTIQIGGKFLLLESKDTKQICGTSWMTCDGRRILLHHFAILPDLWGNGLSKTLLKESLRFAEEKKMQIKLEVHSSNYKAISLYKKYGFDLLNGYDIYIIRDVSNL